MPTKSLSAEFFAELEGEATPFAAAPRFMRRAPPSAGEPVDVVSSIRRALLTALLSAGYEVSLAQRIAEETANRVPAIERELRAAR